MTDEDYMRAELASAYERRNSHGLWQLAPRLIALIDEVVRLRAEKRSAAK